MSIQSKQSTCVVRTTLPFSLTRAALGKSLRRECFPISGEDKIERIYLMFTNLLKAKDYQCRCFGLELH